MSYTESKTFTRISLPAELDPQDKYERFICKLAEESIETWFSGNHFLQGYCTWDFVEEFANEEMNAFTDPAGALIQIKEIICDCLSVRRSCTGNSSVFEVYRDSNTYGDEAHDWILRELLKDPDLHLGSAQTYFVQQDSREGMYVSISDVKLDANGDLESTLIYRTNDCSSSLGNQE